MGLSELYDEIKAGTNMPVAPYKAPITLGSPGASAWRNIAAKECDTLKDQSAKKILLDIYCRIIPLDSNFVAGNQGMMKSDINNFLANKNMTATQYLTSCKEKTEAPLLEFILRSCNNIGKQFMKEADETLKDAQANDINVPPPKADVESEENQNMLVDVKKDSEYDEFIGKLKKKTMDQIVKDVSEIITNKKQEKEMTFDSAPKTESSIDDLGKLSDMVDQGQNRMTTAKKIHGEDSPEFKAAQRAAKQASQIYDKELREYKKTLKKDPEPKPETPTTNTVSPTPQPLPRPMNPALPGTNTSNLTPESAISVVVDHVHKRLWKENVELSSEQQEEIIGMAIRESTLNMIDVAFKQPGSELKQFSSRIRFGKGTVVTESAIMGILEAEYDEAGNASSRKKLDAACDKTREKQRKLDAEGATEYDPEYKKVWQYKINDAKKSQEATAKDRKKALDNLKKESADPSVALTPAERDQIKQRFGKIECSIGKDKDGYYAYTHRARSKSYPSIDKLPKHEVTKIGTTS